MQKPYNPNPHNHRPVNDEHLTPPAVWEAVRRFVGETLLPLEGRTVMRPFWPGRDYTRETYPAGCVVIDNPPFSLITTICRWYSERGVPFFLFAPALTCLSPVKLSPAATAVIADLNSLTYQSGLYVRTSFVTNLWPGHPIAAFSPRLSELLREAIGQPPRPEWQKPVTGAQLLKFARWGIPFEVPRGRGMEVARLAAAGKKIFGGGLVRGTSCK